MGTGQRVLVVDGPSETEEVLRAVLEPRGLQVNRIRAHAPSNAGSRASVVVLHEEDLPESDKNPWGDMPRVIIGSAPLPETESGKAASDGTQYLQKPYHYGELINAIEQLLKAPRPPRRSRDSRRAS